MSIHSEVLGDHNIVLQNIDSSQINITIHDGLSADVKNLKIALKNQLDALIQTIDKRLAEQKEEDPTGDDPNSSDEIKKTLRALKADRCVLFLGPEIAISPNGASLHDQKYQAMSDNDLTEVVYNAEDGFFEPHSDPMFEMDMNDYYCEEFQQENETGREILYHLAQLPFKLIVSSSPDETMHEMMANHDKDHRFVYFEGKGSSLPDEKPKKDKPLIINALGSAVSNGGRFIYTDKEFYEYVSDARYPAEMKKEIMQSSHLLFIGFDLRKWHTRLLLFMLDMHLTDHKSNRLLLSHIPHESIEKFLHDQFQVTHVKYDYLDFVKQLSRQAQKHELSIDLKTFFFKKQLLKLQTLSHQITDAKEMMPLQEVTKELELIKDKVGQHV